MIIPKYNSEYDGRSERAYPKSNRYDTDKVFELKYSITIETLTDIYYIRLNNEDQMNNVYEIIHHQLLPVKGAPENPFIHIEWLAQEGYPKSHLFLPTASIISIT